MTRDYPRVLILAMKGNAEKYRFFEGGSGGQKEDTSGKAYDVEHLTYAVYTASRHRSANDTG
jgi:hypothetical protein